MSSSIALSLASRGRGGTLILTRGLGTSEKRAIDIVAQGDAFLPRLEDDALVQDAIAYIASELGSDYPLVKTLARGVAFHHAGLPPEVRSLVEVLLERGSIRIVAGTSTLAQGVNFPLGAVIVETLKVSQGPGRVDRDLRFSEFWNIAGRAGRALKDPVGLIVYPRVVPKDETDFTNYLVSEASYVVSALADMFARLSGQEAVGLALVREFPALGQFLQYLTHALKVAGFEQATAEVEEILRSSLAFQELQGKGDRETAEKLIRWSTRFMEESRRNSLVGVADSTGLSLPSVGFLAANSPAEMKSLEYWHPDHLFGNDLAPLIEAVELLAQIPELKLGAGDGAGAFNPERVAGIMSDWVNGKTLPVIASAWFGDSTDDLRITGRYLFRHLLGQIPRGLGALQVMQAVSDPSPAGRIAAMTPAMAFYGTRDAKGLVMRMLGVPRAVAAGLGREAPEFTSFASARDWIGAQPLAAWTDAGRHTGVPGSVFRTIWTETGGSAA